jgi:hypothetical protein
MQMMTIKSGNVLRHGFGLFLEFPREERLNTTFEILHLSFFSAHHAGGVTYSTGSCAAASLAGIGRNAG